MRLAPVVLAAVCLLVLFTGLDRFGALDQREARDVQVARELVAAGELLTPVLGDEPLFEKPLLAYAPDAVVRILSRSPLLRSRQFRACAAVLLIIVTASVGAEHFGARAAWFSGLVLATSLGLPLASRTDGTQLLATLFGWVGCAGLADAVFGRRAGLGLRLVVAYAALATALVCAGPLPALWPLGGLALYAVLARAPEVWRRAHVGAGLVLMAGLALPWYGAMCERYGGAFLGRVPFFPYAIEARGPWYAGPVLMLSLLVVGFFPWSTLLPAAILHAATWWRAARPRIGGAAPGIGPSAAGRHPAAPDLPPSDPIRREQREEGAAHFFIASLLAGLVPILVYPGPPLPAVLPALPAAALLCGRLLDHLNENAERLAVPIGRATLMLSLFGSVGAVSFALVSTRVPEAAKAFRSLGSLLLTTSWAPFLANFIGRRRLAAALMALPVALGAPAMTVFVVPAMEGYLNVRDVAEAMTAVSPPHAPLVLVDPPPSSLRLYTRRNLVDGSSLGPSLARFHATDGLTYVAFRPSREHEVARAAPAPLEILIRTPSMVLARVRSGPGPVLGVNTQPHV